MVRLLVLVFVLLTVPRSTYASDAVPNCRLDDSMKFDVEEALTQAANVFAAMGKPFPFETIHVNPRGSAPADNTLRLYIVRDAASDSVTAEGCAKDSSASDPPFDPLSVRGGCVVVSAETNEIRCSSRAVEIFGASGQEHGAAHPALLYVIAHELAHLHQRRSGEYSGRLEHITLSRDEAGKIETLRRNCDPILLTREEEADAIALEVLGRLLTSPSYRQPLFSEQGSIYWNIDQIALAANSWLSETIGNAEPSQRLHPSFVPRVFPTPKKKIARKARRFVCEVLSQQQGIVVYPARSTSHPPIEQRLRRVAEALKPIAERLPASGGHQDYQPIARLQGDLSPILTHIYRETGVYLESLQQQICTMINAADPISACR